MDDSYKIPMVNGKVDSDEIVRFLADTGAPIASSLLEELEELAEEMKGPHTTEEAIPRLFNYVHSAFREITFAIARLEVLNNGDVEPRGVTVQLVEESQ